MSADALFQLANPLALLGWLVLLAAPLAPRIAQAISAAAIPLLLGLAYTGLILAFWWEAPGGFGSLAEVQALAGPESAGSPRRSIVGWEGSRLAMLLAVFDARCGLRFGTRDVYLSVTGGYRIAEPAGDLAAAAALASSHLIGSDFWRMGS